MTTNNADIEEVARVLDNAASRLEGEARALRSTRSYLLKELARSRHPHTRTAADLITEDEATAMSRAGTIPSQRREDEPSIAGEIDTMP